MRPARLLATTLLALPWLAAPPAAAPAAAQRAGTYDVFGVADGGVRYGGTVQLQPTGPDTWRVTWRIGGETVGGVGMTVAGILVVGYRHGGHNGVAAYDILADGRLAGRWTTGQAAVIGTEVLTPR